MSPLEQSDTNSNENGQDAGQEITPELINKIAEKVYKMLLQDLKIQNERFRHSKHELFFPRR